MRHSEVFEKFKLIVEYWGHIISHINQTLFYVFSSEKSSLSVSFIKIWSWRLFVGWFMLWSGWVPPPLLIPPGQVTINRQTATAGALPTAASTSCQSIQFDLGTINQNLVKIKELNKQNNRDSHIKRFVTEKAFWK